MKKQKKEDYPLEYEEYGNAGMYLFAVLAVAIMIGLLVVFAVLVASGTIIVRAIQ